MSAPPRRRERDGRRAGADRGGQAPRRRRLQVTVVCPVNAPREGYVVYQDTRRAAARRRLDKTLGRPARGGHRRATASSSTPIRSTPCATRSPSSSRRSTRSSSRRTPSRSRAGCAATSSSGSARSPGDIPVEHVVVDLPAEGGEANVLVIANETVLGEPLLDADQGARGAAVAGELHDHLPAERPPDARATRRPSGACGARSPRCAARASTRTARSRTPTRTRRRCTRSTTSGSTRSSSRRSRARRARAGCARTSSRGCATRHEAAGRARRGRARGRLSG